jgi:N-methylhydantoinase A/oxoprolinase/acetone carboxylase beta subunit
MKSRKMLSQALDTEYVSDLVPVNEESKEIVPAEKNYDAVEADEDFENVRMTLQELIKTGSIAISDIHSIAQNNEEARSFEVLATLIKTVSETADKLLDSHEKRKKIRNVEGKKLIEPEGGGVSIDKAVFVGTTSDLLRQLKSKDE